MTPTVSFRPCSAMLLFAALAISPMIPAAPAPPALSPEELALSEWAEAHAGEAEALLETLVNINSGTLNKAGIRDVAAALNRELDTLGFVTEWIRLPESMDRAGHLFGRRLGNQGKKLLLIGHLDTVFEPDDPFQRFVREGTWATGPGISDMKGGNVVIIYALKALASIGALENTQIVVAYTGDEERPGKPLEVTRRELIAAGRWADIALGFESGIRDDEAEWATVSRRSSSGWCLEVTGRQAHSSGIFGPEAGAGAIFEAARILSGFYERVRGEEYLTFNAGTILGGTEVTSGCAQSRGEAFGKTNVIPRRVVVRGGLRTISDEQLARARDAMRAVVAGHLPRTGATISFTEGYPAMAPTPGNVRLQELLSGINQALGREPMPVLDPSRRGAADISFVAPYTDSLAGLGAYGDGEHAPEERLDLESLPLAIKRAAILIYRLSRE